MSDQDIEQEIRAKGLTAPRITPADVEANIVSEYYFTGEQGAEAAALAIGTETVPRHGELKLLTFCVLVLRNGFTCVGTSACASPENFDEEIGRKVARAKAIDDVWKVMGYALKERLAAGHFRLRDGTFMVID